MKVNKLQKDTTTIEIDSLELETLQELLTQAQAHSAKLMPRHHDFIKQLNMQLDQSNQDLLAQDKLHTLKERLREALRIAPERQKGVFGYSYVWSISYNPEKTFGVKLDCVEISLYLCIGCKGSFLAKESQGFAHLYIRPNECMVGNEYIELDHQTTVDAALEGKSRLIAYLKDQLLAYMASAYMASKSI
jgi:hypothetical protein